jgi:aryl-alcohol dehydrogenase-like predicted oxidoreductase
MESWSTLEVAMIPQRMLGKTGVRIGCIGLGGEGVLRSFHREQEAREVICRALDLGVNYLESARAYAGSELYYGLALGEKRRDLFLASKSHDRSASGARAHLTTTLKNMRTDYLDLWQVHDVRTDEDLSEIFGPGGAIEAFRRAREEGTVRFLGITGHENPAVILKAFELFDFDTVLMPVNPAEPSCRSFPDLVLPEARRRGLGIIGMKVLCRGLGLRLPGYRSVEPWIRYALSHDLSTIVIGCDTPRQVEENVTAAIAAVPMTADELMSMEKEAAPYAGDLMYYK